MPAVPACGGGRRAAALAAAVVAACLGHAAATLQRRVPAMMGDGRAALGVAEPIHMARDPDDQKVHHADRALGAADEETRKAQEATKHVHDHHEAVHAARGAAAEEEGGEKAAAHGAASGEHAAKEKSGEKAATHHEAHGEKAHEEAHEGAAAHGGARAEAGRDKGHGAEEAHGAAHGAEPKGHGAAEHGAAEHGAAAHGEEHAAASSHGGHAAEVKEGHAAEHGAHGDAGGHAKGGHGERHSPEAHSVAVGMLATVILVPTVISMALSDGRVRELTLKMLDTFTSIFLAVLWFNTFNQALETFDVADMFPYATELFTVIQVVVLYAIASAIAWVFRNDDMRLTTFCSCGAHFIAFAGIGASAEWQSAVADKVGTNFDELAVFTFVLIVAGFLGIMFLINYFAVRKQDDAKKYHSAIEELQLDIVGLVLSFVITQAIRHTLTGNYPAMHLLQVDGGMANDPTHDKPKAWQRNFMLGWAFLLIVLAAFLLPILNDWAAGSTSTVAHQWIHVLKVVLIMLIAWGFLLWGQWEFHEHLFPAEGLFGHMLFAILATFVCLGVLVCMAKFSEVSTTRQAQQTYNIITTGISLVAAWSWEHAFDEAFDIVGHEYQVGYKGLVPKLVLSIVVPAALLPIYLSHVRPRVKEFEEEHEERHKALPGGAAEQGAAEQGAVEQTA